MVKINSYTPIIDISFFLFKYLIEKFMLLYLDFIPWTSYIDS